MERTDRSEKDDAQKVKLIFLVVAVLVVALLIWSFVAASRARSELNSVKQELEMAKSDNIKLEQMVKDATQENDTLKKKVAELEARAKAKAKPAPKKKAAAKTTTKKKHK